MSTSFRDGAKVKENRKMKTESRIWVMGLCLAGLAQAFSAQAALETISLTDNGVATGTPIAEGYTAIQGKDSLGIPANNPGSGDPSVPATGLTTLDYVTQYPLPGSSAAYPNHGWVAIYSTGTPSADYGTTTGLLKLIHFDNSYAGINGGKNQQIFFYSDVMNGSLADAGSTLFTSSANATELKDILASTKASGDSVDEVNNIATWLPSSTQAGYGLPNGGTSTDTYTWQFIDTPSAVPEPSTVITGALLLLPFGVSSLKSLRKNRAS